MERRRNLTPFRASTGRPQPPCGLFIFVLIFFCMLQPFKTLLVRALSQEGFISIDCGFVDGSDYGDEYNGLQYTGDSQFIKTGYNKNVSDNPFSQPYGTLRSFPNRTRNCYQLSPVQSGNKYLVRAGFFYGNYDGKRSPPTFDLHIGVNFWTTVRMGSDGGFVSDVIMVLRGDLLQVCLVNTGMGTPFISVLELRPLLDFMYPLANASQSLVNQARSNYGTEDGLRFPHDPYDRIWEGVVNDFRILNTTNKVEVTAEDAFQVPQKVLQTAVSETNKYYMIIQAVSGSPGEKIYVVMHFAELVKLSSSNASRLLTINGMDGNVVLFSDYTPPYLRADHKQIPNVLVGASGSYNITINKPAWSTSSLIINALESFIVRPMNESETDNRDVSAIEDIKRTFKLTRNWEADPCSPRKYTWLGVSCSYYEDSEPARIISLNLSSSGLDGPMPTSLGNLTALMTLDLSNNNLTGPIPNILGELKSLQILNLSRNEAIGAIPPNICEKILKGALSLSINGGPKQCEDLKAKKKKIIIVTIIIVASIIITMLFAVSFFIIKRKRKTCSSEGFSNERNNYAMAPRENNVRKREGVQFMYSEIRQITQNFQFEIGKGGFGTVYLGKFKDGTKVAVKVLSSSSSQGSKEFEAEVLLLARVHHKNLVCLLGYCDDLPHLSLVYEYMDNKTLRDHLSGELHDAKLLNWNQRVNIALQAAQGLDYLHNGCRPPIVHRDVKSNNILLNCDLVAKLADFGLSRSFNTDSSTHITTRFAGTPGYLAPEYYQNDILNQKSDVYSFGIVLLEIITGQPPHQNSTEKTHIVRWIHSKVESGDITSIIDHRLQGDFDINMAWKILEIAMSCTSTALEERMTMSEVVIQLKQCLNVRELHNVFEDI